MNELTKIIYQLVKVVYSGKMIRKSYGKGTRFDSSLQFNNVDVHCKLNVRDQQKDISSLLSMTIHAPIRFI